MTNEKVSSLKYETRISRFSAELEEYLNSFRLAHEWQGFTSGERLR